MTGTLSLIPNADGGIIDDTMITRAVSKDGNEEYIYQVVNAGCADKDLAHFREQLDSWKAETGKTDVVMDVHWDERGC